VSIPLPPVPGPQSVDKQGRLTPLWQSWFYQLYTYLSAPSGGGGGIVPATRAINTTAPLQGGGNLASDLNLSILTGMAIGDVPLLINFNGSGHAGLLIPDTTGPGLSIKRSTTGPTDSTDVQVTRNANYVGGSGSSVNYALSATTTAQAGSLNFEWAGVFILNNNGTQADATQNVALAAKGHQLSSGITFGANISALSYNSQAQAGCIGLEIDLYANGADVNGVRLPLHVIYGPGSFGGVGHVKDGIRIEQQAGGNGTIDRAAIYVDGDYLTGMVFAGAPTVSAGAMISDNRTGANVTYGLNLGGTYSSAAIFLRDNKNVLWSSDQQTKTRYVSADNALEFFNGANVNWFIGDDGAVAMRTFTVATLPAVGAAGRCSFVTDANATTFNSIVAGGGANKVPVFSDGTNWRIG
jgi:hypothetical protein